MIEIRELSLKVNIDPEPQNESPRNNGRAPSQVSKKAIINECIEQVSAMLKSKKER